MKPGMISLKNFLLTLGMVLPLASGAQTLVNSGSKITVAKNTFLSIKGDVNNEGTIVNNGHMKVRGQWLNSGSFVPGEGHVTFNSESTNVPQIIHHNGQAFNRITFSGGTKKIVLSDMVVGREIVFDNGIVESAGTSRITFDPDVAISGASDSSHVHGIVYHRGSGHKIFPLGNGLLYLPVELPDVDDPSSLIGIRAMEFENVVFPAQAALASISTDRYWHIDVAAETILNSQVILPIQGEISMADPEKIVVVQSPSPAENFTSIGRSSLEDARSKGRIRSELSVSQPFVALATTKSELVVHNAVSNNGDNMNEYLRIENILHHPVNKFMVFNRWGDKIFETENYDNDQRAFRGMSNINNESKLLSGSYFYVLEIPGEESLRGFIAVKN